jgi:hypothetical protein
LVDRPLRLACKQVDAHELVRGIGVADGVAIHREEFQGTPPRSNGIRRSA